jgi:hypothetical protein
MKNTFKYVLLVSLMLNFGCDKQGVNNDLPSLSESNILDMDGELALINKRIPSFGGFYKDEQGVLNVFIKDNQQKMSAQEKASVAAALNTEFQDFFEQTRGTLKNTVVRDANYTWEQLNNWKQLIRGYFTPEKHSIVSLDIDDSDNKLYIEISDASKKSVVEAELSHLKIDLEAVKTSIVAPQSITDNGGDVRSNTSNYPTYGCDASTYEFYGNNMPIAIVCPMADVPNGRYVGGLGYYFQNPVTKEVGLCSIGFNVEWRQGNTLKKGFITAAHCSSEIASLYPTMNFYQNRKARTFVRHLSKYLVGKERDDPQSVSTVEGPSIYDVTDASYDHINPFTGNSSGNVWKCNFISFKRVCRFSDALLVEYESKDYSKVEVGYVAKMENMDWNQYSFANERQLQTTVNMLKGFRISKVVNWPSRGELVTLIGSSTGQVTRRVYEVCIDHWEDGHTGGKVTFLCQMTASGLAFDNYDALPGRSFVGNSGGIIIGRPQERPYGQVEEVTLYGINSMNLGKGANAGKIGAFSPASAIIGRVINGQPACNHKRSEICTSLRTTIEARYAGGR